MRDKAFYFENLDGMRAIAALAVIFAHMTYWFSYPNTNFFCAYKYVLSFGGTGGRLGVIFFFILSGFLITFLLYREQEKNININVFLFYIRRILRIWPLYFIILIIGFIIYPLIHKYSGSNTGENANFLLYTFFLANFDNIYNGNPTSNILGVQWSVSVEEQFYLLWPLIFFLFNRRNYFPLILIAFIGLSEIFSIVTLNRLNFSDYHLLSCLKYLSLGALVAYYCFHKIEKVILCLGKIKKWIVILIYIISITILSMQQIIKEYFDLYKYINQLLPMLFFSFVIAEQNFSNNSFFKISKLPFLTWLGKISYGLYLTHMIALNIIISIFTNGEDFVLLKNLFTILLTIFISYFSYFTVERYFLSLKNKFSYERDSN